MGEPEPAVAASRSAAEASTPSSSQDVLGYRDLPQRRGSITRHRQAPYQQLVIALFERVASHRAGGVRDRLSRAPGRQQGDRRLAQPRLDRGRDAVALHQQPRLERRAGRHVHAFQQLVTEVQESGRIGELVRGQVDIDHHIVPERRDDGVTAEHAGYAESPAQLGERPPQRSERVVGVAEEQLGQAFTVRRPLRQKHIAEKSPRLLAARRTDRPAIPLDDRRSQQPDRQHEPTP
jgi:hypothetical protein